MNEADSHTCMSQALDLGINFFDTAPPKDGLTEEMIGNWFAKDTSRREAVVLTSKLWNAMDTNEGVNNRGTLSKAY